ncbi:MAG: hypothetical protein J6Y49_02845 [Alphaproteobacteria bacterium]|nr:hypothetical protein [Alphaproteobacteria bacterium]
MPKNKNTSLESIVYMLTHKQSKDSEAVIEKCDSKYLDGSLDHFIVALSGINDTAARAIVSDASDALLNHSSEATQLMNDLYMLAKAFDMSCTEKTRSKNWDNLLNELSDKKLQYDIMGCFMSIASENEYGKTTDKMFELRALSPYATPYDVFVFCTLNEESPQSPMFKRGFKLFDQIFEQEVKKSRPDFSELEYASNMVLEYIVENPHIHMDDLEKLIEYTGPALKMRIRIAKLEKENTKSKTEQRTKKTAGLRQGLANITSKTKAMNGDSKQR